MKSARAFAICWRSTKEKAPWELSFPGRWTNSIYTSRGLKQKKPLRILQRRLKEQKKETFLAH